MIGVERIRSNHVAHIHELLYQPAQHVVSAQPKRLGVKAVVTLVDAASVAALDSTLVIAMNGLQQIHARTRSEAESQRRLPLQDFANLVDLPDLVGTEAPDGDAFVAFLYDDANARNWANASCT
jgi:hypothetical protein